MILQNELDVKLFKLDRYIAYENVDQATEEEFALLRMKGFGASESASLTNVFTKYDTRDSLIMKKLKNFVDPTIGELASVRAGKELEPLILSKAEAFFDKEILKPIHMYGDKHGLTVNFDGVMATHFDTVELEMVPVEAKYSHYGNKLYDISKAVSEKDADKHFYIAHHDSLIDTRSMKEHCEIMAKHYGVPIYYYTQVQQQIHFLGAPYGYLAYLLGKEWRLYMFKIYRDDLFIRFLMDEGDKAIKIIKGDVENVDI